MENQSKKRIGDYEILNEIGRGGMGRVYRVRNVISDRIEAMKILLPELAERQEVAARFLREIRLVASLDHPNIGALRTALMVDDQLVMIMEYVEGTSLAERLKQGPLLVAEALDYADQSLRALSHAHKQGVIHRDIKPANMMLTPEGVVKVMDFGIAFSGRDHKLTSTGTTLGSLPYMSPEQVKGEAVDPRSDLYSLGISLYEMVTGQRPFRADSDYSIMVAHLQEKPRPPIELQPGLPASLNAIILQAISKEREQRFQSADEFRNALTRIASAGQTALYGQAPTEPLPAVVAAPVPRVQPTRPSGYRAFYITLGVLLAFAVLIAAGHYYRSGAAGSRQDPAALAPVSEGKPEAKPVAEPAVEPASRPVRPEAKPKAPSSQSGTVLVTPQEKPVEESIPAPDMSVQLDELQQQIDQLTSRVLAVENGLETLRWQQRAAGYDLRGDIVTKKESMKLNLLRANQALEKGDVTAAKKYADLAENYVGQLERFLGR